MIGVICEEIQALGLFLFFIEGLFLDYCDRKKIKYASDTTRTHSR